MLDLTAEQIVLCQRVILAVGASALAALSMSLIFGRKTPKERIPSLNRLAENRRKCRNECRMNLNVAWLVASDPYAAPEEVARAYRLARGVFRRLRAIGEFPGGLGVPATKFQAMVDGLHARCVESGALERSHVRLPLAGGPAKLPSVTDESASMSPLPGAARNGNGVKPPAIPQLAKDLSEAFARRRAQELIARLFTETRITDDPRDSEPFAGFFPSERPETERRSSSHPASISTPC